MVEEFSDTHTDPHYPPHDDQNHTDHDHHLDGNHSHHHDDDGYFVPIPVSEVEGFVAGIVSQFSQLEGSNIMRAEKGFDAFSDERFVYEVVMDRGISLFFNQDKEFQHAALTDDFAESNFEFVKDENVLRDLSEVLSAEIGDIDFSDAEKEFSALEANDFVYSVFFDFNNS